MRCQIRQQQARQHAGEPLHQGREGRGHDGARSPPADSRSQAGPSRASWRVGQPGFIGRQGGPRGRAGGATSDSEWPKAQSILSPGLTSGAPRADEGGRRNHSSPDCKYQCCFWVWRCNENPPHPSAALRVQRQPLHKAFPRSLTSNPAAAPDPLLSTRRATHVGWLSRHCDPCAYAFQPTGTPALFLHDLRDPSLQSCRSCLLLLPAPRERDETNTGTSA